MTPDGMDPTDAAMLIGLYAGGITLAFSHIIVPALRNKLRYYADDRKLDKLKKIQAKEYEQQVIHYPASLQAKMNYFKGTKVTDYEVLSTQQCFKRFNGLKKRTQVVKSVHDIRKNLSETYLTGDFVVAGDNGELCIGTADMNPLFMSEKYKERSGSEQTVTLDQEDLEEITQKTFKTSRLVRDHQKEYTCSRILGYSNMSRVKMLKNKLNVELDLFEDYEPGRIYPLEMIITFSRTGCKVLNPHDYDSPWVRKLTFAPSVIQIKTSRKNPYDGLSIRRPKKQEVKVEKDQSLQGALTVCEEDGKRGALSLARQDGEVTIIK